MSLKSLFSQKKKCNIPSLNPMSIVSRTPSLNSRAQIEEELEQVFKKFDVNNDNKISRMYIESRWFDLFLSVQESSLKQAEQKEAVNSAGSKLRLEER